MISQLQLGDVVVDVVQKDIKNLHLSVHPPSGRVTISAPVRMKPDAIRVFAITKLGWIKQQQQKQREQVREAPRDYVERESHYLWGRRYLLSVIEQKAPARMDVSGNRIKLHVRPGTTPTKRETIMEEWYREELKKALPPLAFKVGEEDRSEDFKSLCAANENQVGKLQSPSWSYPSEYRIGKKADEVLGVCDCA